MPQIKPHIFLFHGPDTYTSAQKIRVWLLEFAKKHGVNNSIVLDCSQKDPDPLVIMKNFFGMHSLFGFTKLAVLKNVWSKEAKAAAEFLAETIEMLPATYFVAIADEHADARTTLFKKIAALAANGRAVIEEYPIPSGQSLARWIQDRTTQLGATLSGTALRALLDRLESPGFRDGTGYDLWRLGSELEKLCAYAHGRPITREDVDLLFSIPLNAHVFDLTDAIFAKNRFEAHRIIAALTSDAASSAKSESYGILSLLKKQLKDAVLLKSILDAGMESEIAAFLSWNPKRVWVVKKKLERTPLERLKRMYALTLNEEAHFFHSPLSPATALHLLAHRMMAEERRGI